MKRSVCLSVCLSVCSIDRRQQWRAAGLLLSARRYGERNEFDYLLGGSVAEWLACWTQAQKGPGSNRSRDAVG